MNKNNLSIKQLIEELKKIDVAEMLEKAKTIKIEDLKSIKLEDLIKISKSRGFYPTIGILLAALFTAFALLPTYKSFKEKQQISTRYNNEKLELPSIEDQLNDKTELKKELDNRLPRFKDLVANSESLFLISELLYDSAKRTLVEISEITPISEEDLNSCTSSSQEELFDGGFDSQNEDFSDNMDSQDFGNEMEGMNSQDFNDGNEFNYDEDFGSGLSTKIYNFSPNEEDGLDIFNNTPKSLDNNFQSNNYSMQIKANYINLLNFLRAIQEYKMILIPVCFEPRLTSPNYSGMEQIPTVSNGEVEARLIINIPTMVK